jgi:hypothetical protein
MGVLLDDSANTSASDVLSLVFEFLPMQQVVRNAAVCSAWRRCAAEKLDEWRLLETTGHVVRGLKGRSRGKMRGPSCLTTLPGGALAVVDFLNHRVQCLGAQTVASRSSGSIRPTDVEHIFDQAHIQGPTGIVPDGKGNLLVADNQAHCIHQIALHGGASLAGALLHRVGNHGREKDELWDPEGLAIDEDGVIYGAHAQRRPQPWLPQPQPQPPRRHDPFPCLPWAASLSATHPPCALIPYAWLPCAFPSGNPVADSGNHRIVCYLLGSAGFTRVRIMGEMGFGDGQLSSPFGVAVAHRSAGGLVYVADTLGNRIVCFTRTGLFVRTIGGRANLSRTCRAPGHFNLPRNIAIVRKHLVVIEDKRVQVLTLDGETRQVIEFGSGPDGLMPSQPPHASDRPNGTPAAAVAIATAARGGCPAASSVVTGATHLYGGAAHGGAAHGGAAHGGAAHGGAAHGGAEAENEADGAENEAGLWGVAADAERVFVTDSRRHRIHVFRLRTPPWSDRQTQN